MTETQKTKYKKTAKAILNARVKYSKSSLVDLYDEVMMLIELQKAYLFNDKAVMEAYGFEGLSEMEILAKLMELY